MKHYHVFLGALVVAFAFTACGENKSVQDKDAVPQTEPAGYAAPAQDEPAVVLMGGYVPSFDSRLRSKRDDTLSDGRIRHLVIMEYNVADEVVEEMLVEDFKGLHLQVKGPIERNGSTRYVAQNSKVGQLIADVYKNPELNLAPGAQGTISFSWEDITKPE